MKVIKIRLKEGYQMTKNGQVGTIYSFIYNNITFWNLILEQDGAVKRSAYYSMDARYNTFIKNLIKDGWKYKICK